MHKRRLSSRMATRSMTMSRRLEASRNESETGVKGDLELHYKEAVDAIQKNPKKIDISQLSFLDHPTLKKYLSTVFLFDMTYLEFPEIRVENQNQFWVKGTVSVAQKGKVPIKIHCRKLPKSEITEVGIEPAFSFPISDVLKLDSVFKVPMQEPMIRLLREGLNIPKSESMSDAKWVAELIKMGDRCYLDEFQVWSDPLGFSQMGLSVIYNNTITLPVINTTVDQIKFRLNIDDPFTFNRFSGGMSLRLEGITLSATQPKSGESWVFRCAYHWDTPKPMEVLLKQLVGKDFPSWLSGRFPHLTDITAEYAPKDSMCSFYMESINWELLRKGDMPAPLQSLSFMFNRFGLRVGRDDEKSPVKLELSPSIVIGGNEVILKAAQIASGKPVVFRYQNSRGLDLDINALVQRLPGMDGITFPDYIRSAKNVGVIVTEIGLLISERSVDRVWIQIESKDRDLFGGVQIQEMTMEISVSQPFSSGRQPVLSYRGVIRAGKYSLTVSSDEGAIFGGPIPEFEPVAFLGSLLGKPKDFLTKINGITIPKLVVQSGTFEIDITKKTISFVSGLNQVGCRARIARVGRDWDVHFEADLKIPRISDTLGPVRFVHMSRPSGESAPVVTNRLEIPFDLKKTLGDTAARHIKKIVDKDTLRVFAEQRNGILRFGTTDGMPETINLFDILIARNIRFAYSPSPKMIGFTVDIQVPEEDKTPNVFGTPLRFGGDLDFAEGTPAGTIYYESNLELFTCLHFTRLGLGFDRGSVTVSGDVRIGKKHSDDPLDKGHFLVGMTGGAPTKLDIEFPYEAKWSLSYFVALLSNGKVALPPWLDIFEFRGYEHNNIKHKLRIDVEANRPTFELAGELGVLGLFESQVNAKVSLETGIKVRAEAKPVRIGTLLEISGDSEHKGPILVGNVPAITTLLLDASKMADIAFDLNADISILGIPKQRVAAKISKQGYIFGLDSSAKLGLLEMQPKIHVVVVLKQFDVDDTDPQSIKDLARVMDGIDYPAYRFVSYYECRLNLEIPSTPVSPSISLPGVLVKGSLKVLGHQTGGKIRVSAGTRILGKDLCVSLSVDLCKLDELPEKIGTEIIRQARDIGKLFGQALEEVAEKLEETAEWVGDTAVVVGEAAGEFGEESAEALANQTNTIFNETVGLTTNIGSGVTNVISNPIGLAEGLGNNTIDLATDPVGTISSVTSNVGSAIFGGSSSTTKVPRLFDQILVLGEEKNPISFDAFSSFSDPEGLGPIGGGIRPFSIKKQKNNSELIRGMFNRKTDYRTFVSTSVDIRNEGARDILYNGVFVKEINTSRGAFGGIAGGNSTSVHTKRAKIRKYHQLLQFFKNEEILIGFGLPILIEVYGLNEVLGINGIRISGSDARGFENLTRIFGIRGTIGALGKRLPLILFKDYKKEIFKDAMGELKSPRSTISRTPLSTRKKITFPFLLHFYEREEILNFFDKEFKKHPQAISKALGSEYATLQHNISQTDQDNYAVHCIEKFSTRTDPFFRKIVGPDLKSGRVYVGLDLENQEKSGLYQDTEKGPRKLCDIPGLGNGTLVDAKFYQIANTHILAATIPEKDNIRVETYSLDHTSHQWTLTKLDEIGTRLPRGHTINRVSFGRWGKNHVAAVESTFQKKKIRVQVHQMDGLKLGKMLCQTDAEIPLTDLCIGSLGSHPVLGYIAHNKDSLHVVIQEYYGTKLIPRLYNIGKSYGKAVRANCIGITRVGNIDVIAIGVNTPYGVTMTTYVHNPASDTVSFQRRGTARMTNGAFPMFSIYDNQYQITISDKVIEGQIKTHAQVIGDQIKALGLSKIRSGTVADFNRWAKQFKTYKVDFSWAVAQFQRTETLKAWGIDWILSKEAIPYTSKAFNINWLASCSDWEEVEQGILRKISTPTGQLEFFKVYGLDAVWDTFGGDWVIRNVYHTNAQAGVQTQIKQRIEKEIGERGLDWVRSEYETQNVNTVLRSIGIEKLASLPNPFLGLKQSQLVTLNGQQGIMAFGRGNLINFFTINGPKIQPSAQIPIQEGRVLGFKVGRFNGKDAVAIIAQDRHYTAAIYEATSKGLKPMFRRTHYSLLTEHCAFFKDAKGNDAIAFVSATQRSSRTEYRVVTAGLSNLSHTSAPMVNTPITSLATDIWDKTPVLALTRTSKKSWQFGVFRLPEKGRPLTPFATAGRSNKDTYRSVSFGTLGGRPVVGVVREPDGGAFSEIEIYTLSGSKLTKTDYFTSDDIAEPEIFEEIRFAKINGRELMIVRCSEQPVVGTNYYSSDRVLIFIYNTQTRKLELSDGLSGWEKGKSPLDFSIDNQQLLVHGGPNKETFELYRVGPDVGSSTISEVNTELILHGEEKSPVRVTVPNTTSAISHVGPIPVNRDFKLQALLGGKTPMLDMDPVSRKVYARSIKDASTWANGSNWRLEPMKGNKVKLRNRSTGNGLFRYLAASSLQGQTMIFGMEKGKELSVWEVVHVKDEQIQLKFQLNKTTARFLAIDPEKGIVFLTSKKDPRSTWRVI